MWLQSLNRKVPYSEKRSAFTLIELLVVIIIIGVALLVVTPNFVNSIHYHKINSAARSTVSVIRYARSLAILKQSDLTLIFNLNTGQVDLNSTNTSIPSFSRSMEGVKVLYVQSEDNQPVSEGICYIPFKRNGTCKPFSVAFGDTYGNTIKITVDALATVYTKEEKNLQ
jgi:prepilin-type N-terminal cleavage/methylation domain-containing protein